MKNLKTHISEAGVTGSWNQTPTSQDGNDTFDISNPAVLQRVNAFVGSIGDREYLIPENAIDQLRNFLMRIGLQFPVVETPLASSMSLPLSQWGGRFGKDLDTPFDEFVNDDGITDRIPGGLSLEIKTEAVAGNGSWKVYAKIK
ncbi:MAG: hypothetical protein QGH83_12295 [Candidatus Pacebacteria bacterium]|jgi:hypothetical protein|nr:hypothetical protein [Candidatus Paceibacterota bacterium]|tara:strand:+ start:35 stop:466 length:432 start_codon:yes stop_codon:yes gene_type:complete